MTADGRGNRSDSEISGSDIFRKCWTFWRRRVFTSQRTFDILVHTCASPNIAHIRFHIPTFRERWSVECLEWEIRAAFTEKSLLNYTLRVGDNSFALEKQNNPSAAIQCEQNRSLLLDPSGLWIIEPLTNSNQSTVQVDSAPCNCVNTLVSKLRSSRCT